MTRVYIVGGGPSLQGFNWARLKGKDVIAINRAYEDVPWAKIVWFSDKRFFDNHCALLKAHRGEKYSLLRPSDKHIYPAWVKVMWSTGADGFDEAPGCIRHGNNGGYAAIHLAAKMMYKEIILLGFDMRYIDGRSHYHDGHGVVHQERTLTNQMLPRFAALEEPLRKRGVTVYNASPKSALDVWPKIDLREIENASSS